MPASAKGTTVMKTHYGLEVIEDCVSCPLLKDRVFCNLSNVSLQNLDATSSSATYPKGATFQQRCFLLCRAQARHLAAASGSELPS